MGGDIRLLPVVHPVAERDMTIRAGIQPKPDLLTIRPVVLVVSRGDVDRLGIGTFVSAEKGNAGRIVVNHIRFQLVLPDRVAADIHHEAGSVRVKQQIQATRQAVVIVLCGIDTIFSQSVQVLMQPILNPVQGRCRNHDIHHHHAQHLARRDVRFVAVRHVLVE